MKKFVINLKRRPDRKKHFIETNTTLTDYSFVEAVDGEDNLSSYKTRPGWIDPFQKRDIIATEIACFLSHRNMWQKCVELDEPIYVIEDDAIINVERWDEEFYDHTIKYWDLLYLQRNENEPENTIKVSDRLERPWYPYNTTAYVISPKGARKLLNTNILEEGIIPVDEYIPEQIREASLMALALQEDSCNQALTSVLASDIREDRIMNLRVATIGTDLTKIAKLKESADHHNIQYNNWGKGVEWRGSDMTGPGGGQKVNILKKEIQNLSDTDILLFVDAYDVFFADSLPTIKERYLDMGHKVLFSAEEVCWPDPSLGNQFPSVHTKYRYLNSGTFIGEVGEIKKILNHSDIEDHQDDQLFYQQAYLEGLYDIGLDIEAYIFQCHEPNITMLGNQLHNQETTCCPCIYHGNGDDFAKENFERIYYEMYPQYKQLFYTPTKDYEVLEKDMLLIDFMTPAQCKQMIEIAESHGDWKSLPNDTAPAQEIRLKEINLYKALELHWEAHVKPVIENYWHPLLVYGVRDAFMLRYSTDTQSKLKLHHDASHVTGSVKLNNDYKGGELSFPRQAINNADIPIGKLLLFPGQVTHPHECLDLKEGTKYSLTIWSQRYQNDIL